jgi:hypothetical protein
VLSLDETLRGAVAELGDVAEQIRLASRRHRGRSCQSAALRTRVL